MKILVTGATGLIGKKLSYRLLQEGHQLVVLGRDREQDFRRRFTFPCTYYSWKDLHSLENVDAVFHLAGDPIASGRWTASKKKRIFDSRIDSTRHLVRHFERSSKKPHTFICASAIGFYGNRGDETLTEESNSGRGFLPSVCQRWEDATIPMETYSRVVRLRIGLVLDCEGGFLEKMESLFSLGLGGRVGSGRQYYSWIHYSDLVELMLFTLKSGSLRGAVNAVAPEPVTNAQFTSHLSKVFGVSSIFHVPSWVLKIALGEMSQLALNSQRVSSDKIRNSGFKFQFENSLPGIVRPLCLERKQKRSPVSRNPVAFPL